LIIFSLDNKFIIYLFIFCLALSNKTIVTNKFNSTYYDLLFNSIEYDYYNLSMIYNFSSNSIKIKHKSNGKNIINKIVCIFGVLANEKGLEIEKSMLQWLLPEYDVYCIYQKYPGKLFEYPALRFAQWISNILKIPIILYVHTKGAFKKAIFQENARALWKLEFTKPRNFIYIQLIKNNETDISLPFRIGMTTLYNGMFISNRAFNLINTIDISKDRYYYEKFFMFNKTLEKVRIKGVINDSIVKNIDTHYECYKYLQNNKKSEEKKKFIIIYLILILIVYYIKIRIK